MYGVATISRLLKNIGFFLQKSPAKETYIFKEPTKRSHPIGDLRRSVWCLPALENEQFEIWCTQRKQAARIFPWAIDRELAECGQVYVQEANVAAILHNESHMQIFECRKAVV